MRTIIKTVYKFDELSDEAKEQAVENLSDINIHPDWWDSTYWDAENIGLKITSFDLERNRHAKGKFLFSALGVAKKILKEHGEHCDTYKTAQKFLDKYEPVFSDYMDESSENFESIELEDELIEIEDEFLQQLLECYSIMLQKEYEYLWSDEAIIETIQANEYEFYENGELL